MMKKRFRSILAALLSAVLLAGSAPAWAAESVDAGGWQGETPAPGVYAALAGASYQGFSDVSSADYYADAVAWAAEQGIVQGTGGGRFSPDNTVTRAEAVTFLWRAHGRPEPASFVSPFTDVTDRDAYYYDAVLWAVEEGLVNGVGGNRFDLYSTLAYDQMMALMCRQAGGDAGGADWSAKAMAWAADSGLTKGLTLSAKAGCPRRDVAYCLWKQLADVTEQEEEERPEDVPAGLTDEEGARAAIINALVQREDELDLSSYGLSYDQFSDLMDSILNVPGYDNYYGFSGYWHYVIDPSKPVARIHLNYLSNSAQILEQNRAVEAAVERVAAQVVTAGMSDYDIAKALHDYLVLNCAYDYDNYLRNTIPSESYTAAGALLEGTAVCSGYAKAYQLLMQEAGIPCEYVIGYAGGGHAWNVVQIGGAWYHVDTTWDDPVPDKAGYVRYDYFLKSDSYMRRNRHTSWTASHTCTSTRYDNADLPDSFEQAEQDQHSAILDACYAAAQAMPYQTEAELQAASEKELESARYLYVDFSESGIDVSILSRYRTEAGRALTERYPQLSSASLDRDNLRYQFRRNDIAEELQRRQDAQEEQQREQEEQAQQEQQEQDAAAAAKILPILQQTLQDMDCETATITLTGYTNSAIELACNTMRTAGYSFGGYTYGTDYEIRNGRSGSVTLTNKKWAAAEEQKYLDQINAALDNRENRIELQPGSYADGKRGNYYASRAATAAKASGYVTPGGLEAGMDYEITTNGTNAGTGIYTLSVRYLESLVLTVDEYVARIEDAIRERKTYVVFQYQDGDDSRANIEAAVKTFWDEKPTVDGLVYGTNYGLTLSASYNDKTCNITITYK